MLFNNNEFDFSFFEISGSEFKLEIDRNKFMDAKEGFQRGNMIRNEYIPYKNYNAIPLVPKTEMERKLYEIMKLDFAIVDLNLYLDMHPEDNDAYQLFQNYVNSHKKAIKDYNETFGPIVVTNAKYNSYEWPKNPWPWDNLGGGMYV